MDSYLMMLYVTLEQESALKQFFLEHGWPYSKPDLSITTDKLGPANCSLVSISSLHSQPTSDIVESAKCSQVPSTAPDIPPISQKPGKRKAKPPPRYAVKTKQAKVAQKQHSTPTSKQKDTMTYIDIDTAGPSNVSEDPSNIEAGPSNTAAGPSNTESSPSNISAGPSNTAVGLSKTAAKTVKVLSITGLDGKETEIKIEVPDAEYEQDSVDQDNEDNNTENNDDDDDDDDYNDNDDDNGENTDIDYSYEGLGQNISPKTVKHSKSGANKTASVSKEQSDGTEKSTQVGSEFASSARLTQHQVKHLKGDSLSDGDNVITKVENPFLPYKIASEEPVEEGMTGSDLTGSDLTGSQGNAADGSKRKFCTCEHCGKIFLSNFAKKRHVKNIHSTSPVYRCKACSVAYDDEQSLEDHNLRCHSSLYYCDQCGKTFQFKRSLNQHKMQHNNQFNFQCELCAMTFMQKHAFEGHMNKHSALKPYQCNICGASFGFQTSLVRHKKKHTKENEGFKCKICDLVFARKDNLAQHKDANHTQKVFPCNECGKTFRYRSSRHKHKTKSHCTEYLGN